MVSSALSPVSAARLENAWHSPKKKWTVHFLSKLKQVATETNVKKKKKVICCQIILIENLKKIIKQYRQLTGHTVLWTIWRKRTLWWGFWISLHSCGTNVLIEMTICNNLRVHQVGSVSVKFLLEEDAEKALKELNNLDFNWQLMDSQLSWMMSFRKACWL